MSNTGGPAYPTNNYAAIVPISTGYSEGMTIRDYFAAKAMAVYFQDPDIDDLVGDLHSVADWCYEMADAMLQAREIK